MQNFKHNYFEIFKAILEQQQTIELPFLIGRLAVKTTHQTPERVSAVTLNLFFNILSFRFKTESKLTYLGV